MRVLAILPILVLMVAVLLMAVLWLRKRRPVTETHQQSVTTQLSPTSTWTFAVSGDSRNCGDVVMPSIAADVSKHAPQFYWHLGDFRFIALVDEDMQCALAHEPQRPAYQYMWKDEQQLLNYERSELSKVQERLAYEKHAWENFTQHQVDAFGRHNIPVYLGIGNHEMILHRDHDDFVKVFRNWLSPATQEGGKIHTYYHWTIGSVDFINLDNAGTGLNLNKKNLAFDDDQLRWFQNQLASDAKTPDVKAIVVGMHAALPYSISLGHSMNESEEGTKSGSTVYEALWNWQVQTHKHVYALASHSHYYMEDIYNTPHWNGKGEVLTGWIVGSAGAHRNPLAVPGPNTPGWKNAKDARTNVYGYLLGTVNPNGPDGSIKFEFHEVKVDAVPSDVAARFQPGFVAWCFQHNTDCADSDPHCEKSDQASYDYPAGIAGLQCR